MAKCQRVLHIQVLKTNKNSDIGNCRSVEETAKAWVQEQNDEFKTMKKYYVRQQRPNELNHSRDISW